MCLLKSKSAKSKRKLQNQRFLRHYAISTVRSPEVMLKMSRSIWKHQSEWASHSNNYMSDLEEFYVAEFKDILDRYPKVDKDDLEDEIEESKQNVHNQLDTHNWWQDVCKGSSAFKGKPAILDDDNLNKPKDEKESLKIKLQQFSSDSLVYYFHPVAFVKAMRRMSGKIWHDPVINPQLNKYSFSGYITPWNGSFGNVRIFRENPLHSGIDIFAVPETEVYACMEGVVVRASTGGGGKTVTIKINSTMDFIKHSTYVGYTLKYKEKGELIGAQIKETDNIYMIYMHLSEFKCKKGDNVSSGDLIALSGVTGNATGTRGPHVHFEIATVQSPYGTGTKYRYNPARVVLLQDYNTTEQDESKTYKYYEDGTKKKV